MSNSSVLIQSLVPVDHSALRVNQIIIILLNITGFVLNLWFIPAFVAVVMVSGTVFGVPGFLLIYKGLLKPTGLVKPDIKQDLKAPHRFAQGFGAVVMITSSVLLAAGFQVAGWALSGLVVVLAALNAFAGFCAGCFVYYQMAKLKVPGFRT